MFVKNLLPVLLCGMLWGAPGKLAIEHALVENTEDGMNVPLGYRFRPGEVVYFRFLVSGYQKKDEDDNSRVRLSWSVKVEDPKGVPLVKDSSGKVDTLVSDQDKDWTPVGRSSFVVDSYAPNGDYRILVHLKDEIGGKEIDSATVFQVAGHNVAPSPVLTVRNLRFLRSEEDADPLKVAAYSPGDRLWVRFDITGYKLGEGNRFSVGYGIRVLRADGSVAYSQQNAAQDSGAPFYPQRYVPGIFSLSIPKDLKTGTYTLAVDVHDATGGGSYETEAKFSVE